jgi:phage terminase large subunit GpA-like protein
MEAVNDTEVQSVVLMWASQTGKTEVINNVVGFFICEEPSPMLVLQPTLDMAETWSKDSSSQAVHRWAHHCRRRKQPSLIGIKTDSRGSLR